MSRLLADLHPIFRPIFEAIISEAQMEGITLHSGDTWRTVQEQAAYLKSGATRVSFGWHNVGLAGDLLVMDTRGAYVQDGADPRYRRMGAIAKSKGCIWGGDWDIQPNVPGKQPDSGHVEYHPNFTMTQYLAWLGAHPVTA